MISVQGNRGISLAELSIVVVAIALLVAVVTVGVNVRKAAELRGFMTDVQYFQVAIESFDLEYDDLPGDSDSAFDAWGSECDATQSNCDGDSDGRIEQGGNGEDSEAYRAWQHLNLGGYIEGGYTGIADQMTWQSNIGINVPASSRSKVGYYLLHNSTADRNELSIGGFRVDAVNDNAALTPTEALSIDKKMDDGIANNGVVLASDGNDVSSGTCFSSSAYVITNEVVACVLRFPVFP